MSDVTQNISQIDLCIDPKIMDRGLIVRLGDPLRLIHPIFITIVLASLGNERLPLTQGKT